MSNVVSIENKEDRIRAILGVTDADVSDTIINYPEYFETALSWARREIPEWSSLNEEKTHKFHSLVLYKTAQLLLPLCKTTVWNIQKEKTTHAEVVYFQAKANLLDLNISEYISELRADILDEPPLPYFFGFDRSGRRGRR